MLCAHRSRIALLTVLGALATAATLAPSASAATQRHASPTGSGTACTSASPCSITQAVAWASAGDEVIVNPGDYPLTQTLVATAQITIQGVAGKPRPRLLFSGAQQFGLWFSHGSVLRRVEIDQAGPSEALWTTSGKLDQVIVKGSAGPNCTALIANSTVRNSIIVGPGSPGSVVCTATTGDQPSASSFRNVTAIASGGGGVAIEAIAWGLGKATVDLVNVIAKGGPGGAGLAIKTDSVGGSATITATHTNFANYWSSGTNTLYINGGGNQGSAPWFVNGAAGAYRQAAGSVTIGAGLDDPLNGAVDVDGDPRRIGTTDIGADEFVVAPAATTGPAGAVGERSATLSGSVNPGGAPTTYHFEYGPTTAYGATTSATDAGSGTGTVAAAAPLGGLNPATTYHYRIVAANAGGVTRGGDQTLTTAAPAQTSTPTPTTAATPAPRPVFAGVRLASTSLTFARRSIALTLRCPAGTVGRCSGQTRLTARDRPRGSRAGSTVTLGRAGFSIAVGRQASVTLRVSRAGRRLLEPARRIRGRAANAARDGAGQSKTTAAAVTIRPRNR